MGQFAGDSLGALVEFQTEEQIKTAYPLGVRRLKDGGMWGLMAGQPTDDSEMALALARTLLKPRTFKPSSFESSSSESSASEPSASEPDAYEPEAAFMAYKNWLASAPFSVGETVSGALLGVLNPDSQGNGALMRVSPLGIFGANKPYESLKKWAMEDAALTHPNKLCQEASALYALAIAAAIRTGPTPLELYESLLSWAKEFPVEPALYKAAILAKDSPPADYSNRMGWVLIAFQNALWQALHAKNFEEGVVDTVAKGGDADTNAAICGALLGAIYGLEAIPEQWIEAIINCRPTKDCLRTSHPRPEFYWPVDVLDLAERLLKGRPINPQKS
jgi:ADP-ribosylglycohydrolase